MQQQKSKIYFPKTRLKGDYCSARPFCFVTNSGYPMDIPK